MTSQELALTTSEIEGLAARLGSVDPDLEELLADLLEALESPSLERLARETRTLRLSLESPIRMVHDLLGTDLTRTQGDLEAIDAALLEATRACGEWLAMIEALPEVDARRLADLGIGGAFVREALAIENGSFERARLRMHGVPTLDRRLGTPRR